MSAKQAGVPWIGVDSHENLCHTESRIENQGRKEMKVAIGSDHAGTQLRALIKGWLEERQVEVLDVGPHEEGSVDYPSYAALVAEAIISGECERGVLICGSGMGMSITANRYPGIRAALCREELSAKMSRLHNDANVLVLGERFTGTSLAEAIFQTWWETPFEGGRHARRVNLIEEVNGERKDDV